MKIENSIVPVELILKLKRDMEEKGLIRFPYNLDFEGAYREMLYWFNGWDLNKYPYDSLSNPLDYDNHYKENVDTFLEQNYTVDIFIIMIALNCCECNNLIHNNNVGKIALVISIITGDLKDNNFPSAIHDYLESKNLLILRFGGLICCGLIRNRMGTDDFETFFRKYKAILQKHTYPNRLFEFRK